LEREQKLWMYESMDPVTKRLQNVRVWDSIWGGKPRFIHAKEATIGFEEDGQAWLALFDGTTYETASDDLQEFRVTAFDRQRVALDFTEALERNEYKAQRPKGMSIAGLKSYIEKKRSEAIDAREKSFVIKQLRDAQAEYHKRFSIPFACLAFGLIGVPLGLIVKRSGKMVGFGIGLGLILVYYLLLQFGQGSVKRNSVISPALAMWIPNIVIGALGVGFSLHAMLEERLRAKFYRQETVTSEQLGADGKRVGESN
ncbi:MAG: LptF/LptG family permease, partial [Candidatus Poribacteria bacterium]|nr:LptF/LptG family permease [Candidatus Poribacteria bacterium]